MKGIIFSLDVLFAILLLSVFSIQITNLYSSAISVDTWKNTRLERQAEDILNALYNRGDLESLNGTRITNSLSELVPAGLGARIQVETYTNGYPPQFVKVNTSYSTGLPNSSEIVQSRRPFIVFFTNSSGSFLSSNNLVKLWVWVK